LAQEVEGGGWHEEGQLQLGEEVEDITAAAASWRAWRFVQVRSQMLNRGVWRVTSGGVIAWPDAC
jgi:hypothetical protein